MHPGKAKNFYHWLHGIRNIEVDSLDFQILQHIYLKDKHMTSYRWYGQTTITHWDEYLKSETTKNDIMAAQIDGKDEKWKPLLNTL